MSRSREGTWLTTRSPMRTAPLEISSSPASIRSAVVLPQPEGPTSTMNSPSPISRSRSRTARVPSSYTLLTWSNVTSATLRLSIKGRAAALHHKSAVEPLAPGQRPAPAAARAGLPRSTLSSGLRLDRGSRVPEVPPPHGDEHDCSRRPEGDGGDHPDRPARVRRDDGLGLDDDRDRRGQRRRADRIGVDVRPRVGSAG